MIYPSIDKLLNVVDSKYELVHIAARRSKEMTKTDDYQMPINKYVSKKNIGKSLEEVSKDVSLVIETLSERLQRYLIVRGFHTV